jgi:hypothetical protein
LEAIFRPAAASANPSGLTAQARPDFRRKVLRRRWTLRTWRSCHIGPPQFVSDMTECREGMGKTDRNELLAEQFDAHRTHLIALAYRMLGTGNAAEDAVQESWMRLSRSDPGGDREPRRVADERGRQRVPRRAAVADAAARAAVGRGADTDALSGAGQGTHLEDEAVVADPIGPALLVVLDALNPRSGRLRRGTTCSPCRTM